MFPFDFSLDFRAEKSNCQILLFDVHVVHRTPKVSFSIPRRISGRRREQLAGDQLATFCIHLPFQLPLPSSYLKLSFKGQQCPFIVMLMYRVTDLDGPLKMVGEIHNVSKAPQKFPGGDSLEKWVP